MSRTRYIVMAAFALTGLKTLAQAQSHDDSCDNVLRKGIDETHLTIIDPCMQQKKGMFRITSAMCDSTFEKPADLIVAVSEEKSGSAKRSFTINGHITTFEKGMEFPTSLFNDQIVGRIVENSSYYTKYKYKGGNTVESNTKLESSTQKTIPGCYSKP